MITTRITGSEEPASINHPLICAELIAQSFVFKRSENKNRVYLRSGAGGSVPTEVSSQPGWSS